MRRRLTKEQRQLVLNKMEGHCAYCGCEIDLQTMQVDHITPLRKGGLDTLGNMWPACRSCNHYKHTLTVQQFRQEVEKAPNRLMRYDTTYRLAVRFGLLELKRKPVTFYFEKYREKGQLKADEGFHDDAGGYHEGGCGWDPNGNFCGECSCGDCGQCQTWASDTMPGGEANG